MQALKIPALKKIIPFLALIVAAGLALAGALQSLAQPPASRFTLGSNPTLPTITFYTTGGATTPQLAFWHAVNKGRILERCNLKVRLWKNLDDLRGTLLAGRGDLWLGHTDGFVQAARRGAPVRLLVTTGWKKFYLVSSLKAPVRFHDFYGKPLAFSPPGSPAVTVLSRILEPGPAPIDLIPHEPRLLAAGLTRGDITAALVPEPLVTTLLEKVPGLTAGENLETIYGRYTNGPARMPIAGLAVNGCTAAKYPELVTSLVQEILNSARDLSKNPDKALDSLPRVFESVVPRSIIKKSLDRDLFLVKKSWAVRDEIQKYIFLAAGPGKGDKIPDHIFWR